MRFWLFVLAVVIVASILVFVVANAGNSHDSGILVIATLPKSFTVTGPYAKLLYDALGIPYGSLINASMLNRPSVRVAWHVDELTLILPSGSKIVIEARTQVIQVKIGNNWITITPNNIKPKYEIKVVKGNETLEALMGYAKQLLKDIMYKPPPLAIFTRRPVIVGISIVLPSSLWPQVNSSSNSSSDPIQTWALSAFVNVNSSSAVCGYVYPDNGSDLVLPVSDYAVVPLTIFQVFETTFNINLTVIPQVGATLWPPALIEYVWYGSPTLPKLLSGGALNLTSPVDWLATGVTLCVSQSNPSDGNYEVLLTASVNGQNYTIATIQEEPSGINEYYVVVNAGPNITLYTSTNSATIPGTPVPNSVSVQISGTSIMLYSSLAFETNDTSLYFFGNNTGFALIFQLGDEPSSVGYWPLFYSISNDTNICTNIWGSSGVGSMWPPNNGDGLWGASGLTVEYPGEPVSYEALIGSLSQMKNSVIVNTVGISCSYVDTELSTLNTEG